MEDLAGVVGIGSRTTDTFFGGKMAGGPLGPFHTDAKELNAAEIKRLYHLGRAALGQG